MKPPPQPQPATKRGVLNMIGDRFQWWRSQRPDWTEAGFDTAVDEALQLVGEYEYVSIEEVCEEIALFVAGALRSGGVKAIWVGNHRASGKQRFAIKTTWGLQARIDLGINFNARQPGARNQLRS